MTDIILSNSEKGNNINLWLQAAIELAAAKEKELYFRTLVLAENFNKEGNELQEGTENAELEGGYKLKAVFKVTTTLVNNENQVPNMLNKLAAMGSEGLLIANSVVKWKPELSQTEYGKLSGPYRTIVNSVVKSKPALPTLELIEPK